MMLTSINYALGITRHLLDIQKPSTVFIRSTVESRNLHIIM